MKIRIIALLTAVMCFTGTFLATATPSQAAYPEKTISLVVWSGAGGALDVYGRKLSEMLTKEVGWANKVENRPGGSGAVGLSYMQAQPADGYTWVICTGTLSFGIAQGLIPFKTSDIEFIRAMQGEPTSLAVPKDSPIKSVQDFLDALKSGQKLRVGGHSSGGFHQYMLFQLTKDLGVRTPWIPHDASGKIPLALLGGHLDVAMMTPSSGFSQVKSGDVRLLAISTEERSPAYPDVPTFKELGFDLVDFIWRGVVVKPGTPPAALEAIQAALDKVEATQEWKEFMTSLDQSNPGYKGEEFRKYVNDQLTEQTKFLESEGYLKK
ncbi:hypothetical protein LJC23_03540 [Desulfovibrio sp. OttesenSCG-928-I05]|nr:hypothetical protein [Desulfovibrio sp. OttesenSCG-928-I05]